MLRPEQPDIVDVPPAESADSLDCSASHDQLTDAPKCQQPETATVAYQFANIARKKLADDWHTIRHLTWHQAKEYLPQLHLYLSSRLATIGDYCIICDDKQPLSGVALPVSYFLA